MRTRSPGNDPDAIALHPAPHVSQRLVPVVESDAKHPAAEGLDDLTLDFELLFLLFHRSSLSRGESRGRVRGHGVEIGYDATGMTFVASGPF